MRDERLVLVARDVEDRLHRRVKWAVQRHVEGRRAANRGARLGGALVVGRPADNRAKRRQIVIAGHRRPTPTSVCLSVLVLLFR